MTDAAIWLLRWTIAGAALSTLVIAAAYMLERKGRAVSLHLYRVSLIAALMAPLIALAPPALTFSAPTSAVAEREFSQTVVQPQIERAETPVLGAQAPNRAGLGGVSFDILAIALIGLWAAGVAFAALRRQQSYAQLSRAFSSGAPYPTSFVECRLSADAPTPLIFGFLRARMLAPADFVAWSPAERESVLRHEAAHLRRGDLVWAALGDAVGILYWWMPPVAALVREHLLVTEEACDSASLDGGEDRHDYARTLLAITRRVGGHATPGLAATGLSLHRRIERLISPQRKGFVLAAPLAAVAACAGVVLALSGPASAQAERLRIYIFNDAGGTLSTYALSNGHRATAVLVDGCAGRLLPNAATIVDRLEARIHNGGRDELNPVTVIGPGSRTELGSCRSSRSHDNDKNDEEHDDGHDEDSLVLIVDASAHQARRFIRQIDSLSRAEQREMLAELGLSERR